MLKPTRMALALVFTLGTVSLAPAQETRTSVTPDQIQVVTVSTTAERVRIAAPNTVVQLRLEVYDDAGQKLFDTEQHGGNVLDWHLQGSSGERVTDGTYLCVVTSKNLTGRLSQKMGMVTVNGKRTEMRAATVSELSLRQTQTVGPMESDAEGLTVMKAEDIQPVTVLANSGDEAQLARTRGALTFRVGDFFSGADKEQMRLTEEGNLGIGTAKPKVKLDVAGMIRAREGFAFADGSKLNVNDKGALTLTNSSGNIVPNTGGAGTQDRLAKWTDNSGNLGDSLLDEAGGGVELRSVAAGVGVNPIFINPSNVPGFSELQAYPGPGGGPNTNESFAVVTRGTGAANNRAQLSVFNTDFIADSTNYEFAALRARGPDFVFGTGKSGTGQNRPFMFAAGFLSDNTTNNGQLFLATTGRVGIGTTTPGSKLDVAGNINISGDYNIGGGRVFTAGGLNTFAGVATGTANTGDNNSFFGEEAGEKNTIANSNSFFGAFAGFINTTGGANAFFGQGSGSQNTKGASNSFIGWHAGVTNTIGDNNTVIGSFTDVGANNLDHATAIGADAVVSSSDTIELGRPDGSDVVDVPGKLQIDTMAATGGQPLCLNSSNRVTMCPMSSLRYKTQVHSFMGGLDIVRRLRPITFTWKEDGTRDLGLGAEEVARVEPLLTFRNKRGQIEGVKYNQVSAVLINAVKEQQQQIQELQREVVRLTNRIAKHHRHVASHG